MLDRVDKEDLSLGEKLSDKIAEFGGSWRFIISFMVFMTMWICINIFLGGEAFDTYPFILLNLGLSCLASLQAPIIMMSQNRQELKDRERAQFHLELDMTTLEEISNISKEISKLREEIKKLKVQN